MAEQEGPNTAMGHHRNRASARGSGRNMFHCPYDTGLGVDGALPPADALVWLGKEGIDGGFKLSFWEVTSGRAVVFPQRCHLVKRHAERFGENSRAINGFLFRTA